MDLAFVVWDGTCSVSYSFSLGWVKKGEEIVEIIFADWNSCPDEAKCLCDVYGVGDCS